MPHDGLEHGEQAAARRELDEAARQLDALGAPTVVAPDHEQLQRDDGGGRSHVLVELRLLDGRPLRLVEHVDGEDQPVRHVRLDGREVVAVDQEARRMRGELARDASP